MADHAHNLRARSWTTDGPVGVPTRGTTGYNRLRKSDRWLVSQPRVQAQLKGAVREGRAPVAIDVGYGASHTTTVEWARFLRSVEPSVEVTGLEIEPSRVLPPRDGVRFALGGFELAGMRADVVRAFNVLRQYDVDQVHDAWRTMQAGLHPGGVIIEGTCCEIGRRATWVLIDEQGPQTLTMAWQPEELSKPSEIAERLPKALIHLNTPGHAIYDVLQEMDAAWNLAAPLAVFGPRVRWREALNYFHSATGLPRLTSRRRLQDNSLTVPWSAVAEKDVT
ncbi:class I SAM-dependent methyltransferase [Corynebacterium urogenitale]